MSILLRVAYDGTDFRGWARQHPVDGGPELRTVQGELERVLGVLCKEPVSIFGASRTDAGVHAAGQLAAFERVTPIPCEGLVRACAALLPRDMSVIDAWDEVGPGGEAVRPRFGNGGKHYRYRIRCAPLRDPRTIRYEWHLGQPLNVPVMQRAAADLVGEHDFASFRSSTCQAQSTIRRIDRVDVRQVQDVHGRSGWVDVDIVGSAFLHNMVRIIVGTLVEVGLGQRPEHGLASARDQCDRRAAGRTAPAEGLTLMEVLWGARPMASSTE